MRNIRMLAGWLFLLAGLQAAATVLDGFHHLEWGLLGMLLIKAGYLGFALVLFLRYRSFRDQKPYETLAESYRNAVGREPAPDEAQRSSRRNPVFDLALALFAAADLALVLDWNPVGFRISILLDLVIWIGLVRWLVRVQWLKARGARERLKEAVDAARSKRAGAETDGSPRRIPKAPFRVLAGIAMTLAAAIAWCRWSAAERTFRIDALKQCMEGSMRALADRYYGGEALNQLKPAGEPRLREMSGSLEPALWFSGGDLLLRASETPISDFFGDGTAGNQGLILDANGRFRKAEAGE